MGGVWYGWDGCKWDGCGLAGMGVVRLGGVCCVEEMWYGYHIDLSDKLLSSLLR